ncbi:MAG: PKD domain-containing protein [Planctomycetota bacterium]
MLRVAFPLAVSFLAAAASAQFQVVIPAGMATAEGSTSNAFPWGRGGTGLLHQCVYDSSHFTTQGITTPIFITGLKWRPNTNVALVASSYTAGCSVTLSTAPVDHTAVTNVLAANRGADITTCYSGVVSWGAQAAQAGPTPFGISVPFTTNFLYDPSLGDLNIECDLPIQTFSGTGPQLDVHGVAGQALASRVWMSTGYPTGTVSVGQNHAVVVEVTYLPAVGLTAGFSANVTGGPSPLAVNFTNASFSSAPGGITSYAWDFDGDSVVDSTLPNPSWTYTACGSYTVSLTVNDGVNPPATLTRANYVVTDRIAADFTFGVIAPLTVQFTDTSNMAATTWAWDFNGDGVVDSTAQNPVHVFPNAVPQNVRLTTTRLCGPPSTQTKLVSGAQEITTLFAGGNGGAALWTVYFDVNVTNPAGVEINGFAANSSSPASTPFSLDVYAKQGTYVGNTSTPAAWHQLGTASGTTAGPNLPSPAALPSPIYLPQGNYALALRYVGAVPTYSNGASNNTVYSNTDLTLTLGAAQATTTAPFTGGSPFTPRVWNGTIYYETHNVFGGAAYGWFGNGCNGTLGMTSMPASAQPTLGGTLTVGLDNLAVGLAVMVLGTSNTAGPLGPLPLDLGILGAPGCPLRVSVDATDTVVGAGTTATWNFTVPNALPLSGVKLYNQAAVLDPALNAFGFALSRAYGWILGN